MREKIKKVLGYALITGCSIIFAMNVNSETMQSTYEATQQFSRNIQTIPSQTLHQFQPKDVFTHFESTPSQSRYYGGETAMSTALTTDATMKAAQTAVGQVVTQSVSQHPDYRIDTQSLGTQRSQVILKQAASIAQGISTRYADCTKTQTCQTAYQTEDCEESNSLGSVSCTKDLIISATPGIPNVYIVTVTLIGTLQFQRTQTVTHDLSSGKILSTPLTIRATQSSLVPSSFVCIGSQVTVMEQTSLYRESPTTIHITQLPDCSHPLQVTLQLQVDGDRPLPARVAARVTLRLVSKTPPLITEEWRDSCQSLRERLTADRCAVQNAEACSSSSATRIINGVSVTRPCWQTTTHYQCAPQTNTCKPLREKGCEQIGSTCSSSANNQCLTHLQTFRCPIQQCTKNIGIVCNGETFCLSGDCTKPTRQADPNFKDSVSKLAAMNDAAKQFDTAMIFKGRPSSCTNNALGYSNCCRDTGWGVDLNLAHCDQQDKQLGHDKLIGLTVYVGEYCSHRVLGACTSKRKMYCTFPSKLARIVQQQGRPQLGMTFGKADKPHCEGFTPEQLQRIDMSKIDFHEFYSDVMKAQSTASSAISQQQIEQRIQAWSAQGLSHDNH